MAAAGAWVTVVTVSPPADTIRSGYRGRLIRRDTDTSSSTSCHAGGRNGAGPGALDRHTHSSPLEDRTLRLILQQPWRPLQPSRRQARQRLATRGGVDCSHERTHQRNCLPVHRLGGQDHQPPDRRARRLCVASRPRLHRPDAVSAESLDYDPVRMAAAHVPDDTTSATKPALAVGMI